MLVCTLTATALRSEHKSVYRAIDFFPASDSLLFSRCSPPFSSIHPQRLLVILAGSHRSLNKWKRRSAQQSII
jgi:hypothetical protein